jgi:hypothetical protein
MDYDIKRGWFKKIEGDALPGLMKEVFGNVKTEGDVYVSEYGVMTRIEVKIVSKDKMDIATATRSGPMTDEEILDSKRKLNVFAEKATGFDAKARMKRAQKKAKEGTL